jgi:hypothetical protein
MGKENPSFKETTLHHLPTLTFWKNVAYDNVMKVVSAVDFVRSQLLNHRQFQSPLSETDAE